MPQKLDELKTGIKDLDEDLRELFAICEVKKKLDAIKQAIANKDISSEEFSEIVPEALIKLSLLLAGPQFGILLEDVNEGAIDLVQEAKSLIEKHFGNLFQNENAKSMLNKMTERQQAGSESLFDEVIRGVGYHFMWEHDPPELTPAVSIVFKNRKRKILLSTRFDWEDFSSLFKNLSEIFVELLEKGKPLAELGQIDLDDSQEVLKNIEEALGNLQKIKEIMPIYKAKTESDDNKQSVKDSSSQN
ncbi:MAG: hypothetical protein CEE38_12530 [Planctomycetes bacterium B3_Pla]|nr:MAG: hypothetical protein CEE38_12530 [Planctomycetes bacterium B3_Pla]